MATNGSRRQIKIFVTPEEQDQIRLAAAFRRGTMAKFCRETALAEAKKLTMGIAIPGRRKRGHDVNADT